jgi:hypothetical protein
LDWVGEVTRAGVTAGAALVASFLGAKWAESRKIQARFEKLDRIREEMREVTRVQEEIKRQLQSGEWNRQTLWKQRLDSYTELLRVSTDYLDRCYVTRSQIAHSGSNRDNATPGSDELHRLRAETFKAVTVVEIFGDSEVLSALKQFFESTSEPAPDLGAGASVDSISREIEALRTLQTTFVAAARAQLKGTIDR